MIRTLAVGSGPVNADPLYVAADGLNDGYDMSERLGKDGPYHRTGQPGGPGCQVASLPITVKGPDGPWASAPLHHGLYEVHLPVTDVDRAVEFYVAKLGFELGRRESASSALLLYTDGGLRWMLGLFRVDAVERPQHISFRVAEADADRMTLWLRERAIEPVHPPRAPLQGPMHEPIVHGWMPAAAVFFRDPDGHLLELIADLSDTPRADFLYRTLSEWRALS